MATTLLEAPAVTTALTDDKIPVLPLVLVAVALGALVNIGDAALQLRLAKVVQQPGIFLVTEAYPAICTKLVSGDI